MVNFLISFIDNLKFDRIFFELSEKYAVYLMLA